MNFPISQSQSPDTVVRHKCVREASGQSVCSGGVCLDADSHCLGTLEADYRRPDVDRKGWGELQVPANPTA
jgi:hypothetical protein